MHSGMNMSAESSTRSYSSPDVDSGAGVCGGAGVGCNAKGKNSGVQPLSGGGGRESVEEI
jgi:hypothetical protein